MPFDRELVGAILALWAFAGMIVLVHTPSPKTKLGALVQLVCGGPFAWTIFVGLSLLELIDRLIGNARE